MDRGDAELIAAATQAAATPTKRVGAVITAGPTGGSATNVPPWPSAASVKSLVK